MIFVYFCGIASSLIVVELHWNLYMYDIRFATWDFTMNLPCFYPDFTFRSYIQSRVRWLNSSCEAFFCPAGKKKRFKKHKKCCKKTIEDFNYHTHLKFDSSPLKSYHPKKERIVFQPSSFRVELLNFGGVDLGKSLQSHLRCFGSSGFGEG